MISIQKARQIYNEFTPEGKDMSFQEFFREINDLTDQRKIQEDLMAIQMIKARQDSNKLLIDKGLEK